MSGYRGHNRPGMDVQRSYTREHESLFDSYEHLLGLPRGDAALTLLRKVASMVKPIMRKRGWRVQVLAEFLPPEYNLLGLNINKGFKICIRLRYHHNPDLFMPVEEVCDTMLHELSHNVHGAHDATFHALWEELRIEYETLVIKGFTGEGFLSDGHMLGGGRYAATPPHEMRRLARASAEQRQKQNKLIKGSGKRLGGTPFHLPGSDVRQVITKQITRRNTINRGCASGRDDANQLSQQSADSTFKTEAQEDDANNRAIAQALYELMEQEEERKLDGTFSTSPTDGGLAWHPEHGLYDPRQGRKAATSRGRPVSLLSEGEQLRWAIQESMGHKRIPSDDDVQIVSPLSPEQSHQDMAALKPPATAEMNVPPVASSFHLTFQPSRSSHDISSTGQHTSHGATSSQAPVTPTSAISGVVAIDISEPFDPNQWICTTCTCINPIQYLACDACASERPQAVTVRSRSGADATTSDQQLAVSPIQTVKTIGWSCPRCNAFMEHKWWTCSSCGTMKNSS